MSISEAPITGQVILPDGSVAASGTLIFTLMGWDTEDQTALPSAPVSVALGDDGALPEGFTLWRNIAGRRGTHYLASVRWIDRADGFDRRREADLGPIQIGEAVEYTIAELLDAGTTVVPETFSMVITQSQYDRMIDAEGATLEAADVVMQALNTVGAGLLWFISETSTSATFSTANATVIADPGPGPYPSIIIEVQ